jgi:hypothetical protein
MAVFVLWVKQAQVAEKSSTCPRALLRLLDLTADQTAISSKLRLQIIQLQLCGQLRI